MEAHAQPVQLTPDEHERYLRQLEELRRVRDRDLPELLREARTLVAEDAAEEIAQIRDDHVVLERRIARLEELLAGARIVLTAEGSDAVCVGHTVQVEYTRTGRRATYRLAGSGVAGGPRTVSAGSPVGRALLGRPLGALVSVELPDGRVEELRIIAVDPIAAVA